MSKSNRLRYIAVVITALLSLMRAEGQQTNAIENNEVSVSNAWVSRDNYTLVIEYRIDMGENVTSCDVELMISQDGGSNFTAVSAKEGLTGDIGKVSSSGQKIIIYDINSIKNELAGKDLAFKVQIKDIKEKKVKEHEDMPEMKDTKDLTKVKKSKKEKETKGKFFIMGTGSTFGMYGLKAGFANKFGGYISYSDAFTGNMLDNWNINGGVMIRATRWLYPFIGAGYGQLNFYDDDDDYYVKYNMIPLEAGAMCKFGAFLISAAVEPITVIGERFGCSFELGIGFCF